jgi:hypothetical protein
MQPATLYDTILPSDEREARTVATQALNFVIMDNVLYFVETHGSDEEVPLNDRIDVIHGFSGNDDATMIQDESQSSQVQDES